MQSTAALLLASLTIMLALPTAITAQTHSTAIIAKATNTPGIDPCKLLTDAEVRKVFPDAKAGKLDRSLEEHGIISCIWDHTGGRFSVQTYKGEQGTIDHEIRGMSLMFLDPLKPGADRGVRYETVKDVGDQARAIVETADPSKGFLTNSAMLITQRKGVQLTLMSTQLASRDRSAALKALEELGRAAAKRL